MMNGNGQLQDRGERDFPLTFAYYAALVARRAWIPASLAVLGACLSLVYTGLQDTAYGARATIVLSPLDAATADELPRLAPTVARLLRSDRVLVEARPLYLSQSATARPDEVTPDDLRARITVRVPRDTSLFEVNGQGPTQLDANALVRAVVRSASGGISQLGARPRPATGEAPPPLRLEAFGPTVPEGKVSPTPVRNLIVGVNLGLLLGIVGALLLRDPRRARTRADDLAELLDASDLVYAPLPFPRLFRDRPFLPAAQPLSDRRKEGIRVLGGRLWRLLQQDRRVVLLVGDLPPQTLRSVALELAFHVSRTGIQPVVVEADYHGQGWDGAHDDEEGLGHLMNGGGNGDGPVEMVVSPSSRNGDGPAAFTVVRRGTAPSEPALAFASDGYKRLVSRLASRHDLVLVVGPASDWRAEVLALAEAAHAVVLLVPPWVAHSRAAALTTLQSVSQDSTILVSVFGEAQDVPLGAVRER
jgi:hypothetical protein